MWGSPVGKWHISRNSKDGKKGSRHRRKGCPQLEAAWSDWGRVSRLRQRCCRLNKGGCRLREEGEGQAFQDETDPPVWRTVVPRPSVEKEFGDSRFWKASWSEKREEVGCGGEKAMAPHCSLVGSMGSLRVGHDWATSLSLFTFMHWRRKWQPTPVLLPGESQGRRGLVGCHLWGHTESDTTEAT